MNDKRVNSIRYFFFLKIDISILIRKRFFNSYKYIDSI